ncbi:MAG: paraslipin [Bermanella sp.]|nr:paraslipin [Bermanella sp.]
MIFSMSTILAGIALVFVLVVLKKTIIFVPQNRAWLVERFGKYHSTKIAGLNFMMPFIDRIAADRSLKEQAQDVPSQAVITKDNISLVVDGVLYLRVVNPYDATYGVDDYAYAVTQLAQTTMRSAIGKMELDRTFEEREALNADIVESINQAAEPWGIQLLRYEIKDIVPPKSILESMEAQMKAERVKRAQILESEGDKQAAINVAEGQKASMVLAAEADKAEQILRAEGEAQAILAVADAQAKALKTVGDAAKTEEGQKAVQLDLATKAIEAQQAIAKESSIILLPSNDTGASSLVASSMAIINKINEQQKG